jgi:hypothetical protein
MTNPWQVETFSYGKYERWIDKAMGNAHNPKHVKEKPL